MKLLLSTLTVSALLCAPAAAQNINIDIGNAFGTPSSAYGAAAAQPGTWNTMTGPGAMSLSNTAGAATTASISATGGAFTFFFDNPGTTGDDELLMDDACDGAKTYNISGLTNGTYEVFTYAWAPDSATYLAGVAVPGSTSPTQTVGGNWPGGHQLGVTYARHDIVITNGTLQIVISTVSGFATSNGIQIKSSSAGCPPPTTYCTAKTTSNGCVPSIGFTGTATPAGNLVATCTQVEVSQLGVLFYGTNGPSATSFQGGFLCVAPPVTRFPFTNSGGSAVCTGTYSQSLSSLTGTPGMTFHTQFWFRDPGSASGTGLSNGLTFTTCP